HSLAAVERGLLRCGEHSPSIRRPVAAASVELEAPALDVGTEIRAFRARILPGLVLRPAVELGAAEAGLVALLAIGEDGVPPAIIGIDLLAHLRIVEAVAVHTGRERQPRAHVARIGWPAEAERRH